MRQIPQSLLDKIKDNYQTKANDADPKLEIILRRNSRYIEDGTELFPKTIRERDGSLDLAMRRENSKKAPDRMYMVWIDNDSYAKISTQPYINAVDKQNRWSWKYTVGTAVDVAIEFDGYWVRTSSDAEVCFDDPAVWTHITYGEPWIFRVLTNGKLLAQQGENGENVELVIDGVTQVSAIRAWKPVPMPEQDNGLIVAYIRNNIPYYRAYAEQDNGEMIWEEERSIPNAPTPAQSIGVFRTNDFRTGFAIESDNEVWAIFSERNWAGMSIEPENTDASMVFSVNLMPIIYESIYSSEYTNMSLTSNIQLCPINSEITLTNAERLEQGFIITFSHSIYNLGEALESFNIVSGANYNITNITITEPNILVLDTNDIMDESLDVTLNLVNSRYYKLTGEINSECKLPINDFSELFVGKPPEGFTSESTNANLNFTTTLLTIEFLDGVSIDSTNASMSFSVALLDLDGNPV